MLEHPAALRVALAADGLESFHQFPRPVVPLPFQEIAGPLAHPYLDGRIGRCLAAGGEVQLPAIQSIDRVGPVHLRVGPIQEFQRYILIRDIHPLDQLAAPRGARLLSRDKRRFGRKSSLRTILYR